jgi:hypothetical protein
VCVCVCVCVCVRRSGLIFAPMITFGKWDGRRKRLLILLAVPLLIGAYVATIYLFYNGSGILLCPNCKYVDCLPADSSWCRTYGST